MNFNDYKAADGRGLDLVALLHMKAEKDYTDLDRQKSAGEAEIILNEIAKLVERDARESLKRELRAAQESGDTARENEILKKIMQLTK